MGNNCSEKCENYESPGASARKAKLSALRFADEEQLHGDNSP